MVYTIDDEVPDTQNTLISIRIDFVVVDYLICDQLVSFTTFEFHLLFEELVFICASSSLDSIKIIFALHEPLLIIPLVSIQQLVWFLRNISWFNVCTFKVRHTMLLRKIYYFLSKNRPISSTATYTIVLRHYSLTKSKILSLQPFVITTLMLFQLWLHLFLVWIKIFIA